MFDTSWSITWYTQWLSVYKKRKYCFSQGLNIWAIVCLFIRRISEPLLNILSARVNIDRRYQPTLRKTRFLFRSKHAIYWRYTMLNLPFVLMIFINMTLSLIVSQELSKQSERLPIPRTDKPTNDTGWRQLLHHCILCTTM